MSSSYFAAIGRAADAPPDISKTNYLDTETDMTKPVNQQIDQLQKGWETHYNQLIKQWDHMHKGQQNRPQQILDTLKGIKTTKEEWDDWMKWYQPHQAFVKRVNNQIDKVSKLDPNSAEYKFMMSNLGAGDPDVDAEINNSPAYEANKSKSLEGGYELIKTNPLLAQLLLNGVNDTFGNDSSMVSDMANLKNTMAKWYQMAHASMEIFSGEFTEDGEPIYWTYDNAPTERKQEFHDIATAWFVKNHEDVARGRFGKYKKDFVAKLIEEDRTRQTAVLETHKSAVLENQKQTFLKDLELKSKDDPSYPITFMEQQLSFPEHLNANGDPEHRIVRNKTEGYMMDLLDNESWDMKDIEKFGDVEFNAFGHEKPVKVKDHWPKMYERLEAKANNVATAKAEELANEKKANEARYITETVENWEDGDDKTIHDVIGAETKFRDTFGYATNAPLPAHAAPLLNLYYKMQVDDIDIASELRDRRYRLKQKVVEADLQGITDPRLKEKLRKELVESPGGYTQGDGNTAGTSAWRDNRVKSVVNAHTQETELNTSKTKRWWSNYDQAIAAFDSKYQELISLPDMTPAKASQLALEYVEGQIGKTRKIVVGEGKNGEKVYGEIPQWDQRPGVQYDPDEAQVWISHAKSYEKDYKGTISSAKQLEGETPHVESGAQYLKDMDEGKLGLQIPQYWRYLGRTLKKDPHRLLRDRLVSLGFLKPDELTFPEEGLAGEELLVNPTASKTLRFMIKNPKNDWMIETSKSPTAKVNGEYLAIRNEGGYYESIEDVLEKPLKEITVADIVGLIANNAGYTNIGAFDLTTGGVLELIEDSSIPLDTIWDKDGQDFLYLARLRQKAEKANKNSGVSANYRRLVTIDKNLHEQFKAIAGDLPPWLDIDTLQPEVAKELVKMLTTREE